MYTYTHALSTVGEDSSCSQVKSKSCALQNNKFYVYFDSFYKYNIKCMIICCTYFLSNVAGSIIVNISFIRYVCI